MPSRSAAPHLSVVIITLNEERRIAACLQSLPSEAEVVVLDSGSTDRTCQVAAALGAKVATRTFTNYAEQKNAAVALATRPWVLSLDADEVVDTVLAQDLARATAAAGEGPSAYRLRRQLVFLGRPMRFGKTVDHPLRLFRRGAGTFEAAIHERFVVTAGTTSRLRGSLLHTSYENLTDYFQRFNTYTTKIAENHLRSGAGAPALPGHLLRPWFEFLSRYVLRLGFLDGYAGYTYALVSSLYAYIKYATLRELELSRRGTP